MKLIAGFAVLVMTLASCQQRDHTAAIDALHRDVVKITQQLADVRVHLTGLNGRYDALAKENATLRERVRQLELNYLPDSTLVPAATSSAPTQSTATAVESAPRRGGFTDWGASTRSSAAPAPRVPERGVPPSTPTVRTIGNGARSITNDHAIVSRCAQEWKTDYRMIAYCEEKQQTAKDKLDRGNLYGISGMGFDTIRRDCQREWGTDYAMRVYCEEKQAAAYKQVNRQ